ncbi:hypothetical protein K502DRAFT_339095 [Neoconidiobolus thromboides FSU 785]|nr:hypothetical protein K502DRAFT_339095 [Neoconidiobolus thromboides FSU 785]
MKFFIYLLLITNIITINFLSSFKNIKGILQFNDKKPALPFHFPITNHITRFFLRSKEDNDSSDDSNTNKSNTRDESDTQSSKTNKSSTTSIATDKSTIQSSTTDKSSTQSSTTDKSNSNNNDKNTSNKDNNSSTKNCTQSRIFFIAPLQSSLAKMVLAPIDGSITIKWTIDPPPKQSFKLNILLEKRTDGISVIPIADKLTKINGTYNWDIGAYNERENRTFTLNSGQYRLFIHQDGLDYTSVSDDCKDLIAAATQLFIFDPTNLDPKFMVSSNAFSSKLKSIIYFNCILIPWILFY